MYKLSSNSSYIIRLSDGAWIPREPKNRDYGKFLKWENQGNTIQDADPEPVMPKTDSERIFDLLLKLSNPVTPADIAEKQDLLSRR